MPAYVCRVWGESSPLVTEVESPKSIKMTHAGDQVDNNTDQVPAGIHCADDPVKELIAVL